MFIQILKGTPAWAFVLFFGLLALMMTVFFARCAIAVGPARVLHSVQST